MSQKNTEVCLPLLKTMFPGQVFLIWPRHSKMHKPFLCFCSMDAFTSILLLIDHSQNNVFK